MNRAENRPSTPIPGVQRGKKYRFTVKSAEEAIRIIKERLGPEAEVLSVTQLDGQGLSRFLNSPKLEIIAMIPEQEEPVSEKIEEVSQESEEPSKEPVAPSVSYDPIEQDLKLGMDKPSVEPRLHKNPFGEIPEGSLQNKEMGVWHLLRKAGFADNLLNSLRYTTRDDTLETMPLPLALAEISQRLRKQYKDLDPISLTGRIAFLGTPGVGKTTALCKRLAQDVFISQKKIQVLKIDSENPNPDDGLSVFCDVLGVPLLRDPIDEALIPESEVLYLDLPGTSLRNQTEWQTMKNRLDQLHVETRVLVIHSCYESDSIHSAYELGKNMGATHIVLTHVDELSNVTKLWPFILRGGLTPFFISKGQSITSDYADDILNELSGMTFPASLIS